MYNLQNGIALFSVPAIDDLNLKYNCISAKRINAGRKSKNHTFTYVLQFSAAVSIDSAVLEYMSTGDLEYAEPDYIGHGGGVTTTTPNDADFSQQWALYNNGTFGHDSAKSGADINMKMAWDIEKGDTSIIVAIVDCGAKLDHMEFRLRK